MNRNKQYWKRVVVYFSLVLLIANIIPTTTSLSLIAEQAFQTKRNSYDLIHISGTMGNNGWYISYVTITIHPPQGAGPVFYRLNDQGWSMYEIPVLVDSDGVFIISCYYFDEWGNQSPIYNVSFKIDKTPPDINITVHRDGRTVIVTVDAVDNMSGVALVEFYSDGSPIGTLTAAPYEYSWTVSLFGEHTVAVIVYDAAGNSDSASHTFPYDLSSIQSSFFQRIYRVLQNLILIYQLLIGVEGGRI